MATKSGLVGGGGYLLGGPIVHIAHGDYVEAGVDLGLRAGLPLGGALLGAELDTSSCKGDCDGPIAGVLVGGMAGGVAALVIDYTLLSTHDRGMTASFTPAKGGGVLAIAGRF